MAVVGVAVIAVLQRTLHYDCIVLVKQFRPPINGYCLEFPAGKWLKHGMNHIWFSVFRCVWSVNLYVFYRLDLRISKVFSNLVDSVILMKLQLENHAGLHVLLQNRNI